MSLDNHVVSDLNCVTNIPLKVIIQLGQRGIEQIMVDGDEQHVLMWAPRPGAPARHLSYEPHLPLMGIKV